MSATFSAWLFRLGAALRWYFRAGTRYDVHSPLLNNFIREVYRDRRGYHAFTRLPRSDRGRFLFRTAVWLQPGQVRVSTTDNDIVAHYLAAADSRVSVTAGLPVYSSSNDQPTLFYARLGETSPERLVKLMRSVRGPATALSVWILEDIHRTAATERTWNTLLRSAPVGASVDTYRYGILFFRNGLTPVHVSLIRTTYKPWRLGFFG